MRVRRTVKEKDVIKILAFGCDRKLIKSAMDSGFRSMSAVLSYANCMAGNKPVNHIRVSNESRGWCGSYYPIFSCSSNPFHPQGIAMYVGDYYPWKRKTYNFGKRVRDLASLPEEVIKYIKIITT